MSKKDTLKESQTDWARTDPMSDDDIGISDNPEVTEEMWAKAVQNSN